MWAQSIALAFKPFRDAFVFSGRSRRSEVVAFFLLGMLANSVTIAVFEGGIAKAIGAAWSLLWSFPWIALFVRRLHDQGRSARWAWALAAAFAALLASAPLLPQSVDSNYHVTLPFLGTFHPTGPPAIVHGAVGVVLALIMLGLWLAPEQSGTNRYGPDPRLDPEGWEEVPSDA